MADIYSIKDPAQANVEHYMYCIGQGYGTCSTTTSTSGARIVTLSGYKAVRGFVSVKFKYSVPAAATMNINSAGQHPIKLGGQSIGNGVIKDGRIASFYFDGASYNLVGVYSESQELQTSLLYDFYSVSSSDDVVSSTETYLLLYGENGALNSSTVMNGSCITIEFDLQDGVAGLIQAGLTNFCIKFEDGSDDVMHITDVLGNPLPMSGFLGAKSITAEYCAADGVFYITGVQYNTTDTAASGSKALITSGGVYSIIGDIESILASI